jgi:hypothetical protein
MNKRGYTLKDAKAVAKQLDMSINKTQAGDYRISQHGLDAKTTEARAYYTDDLTDAVATMQAIALGNVNSINQEI